MGSLVSFLLNRGGGEAAKEIDGEGGGGLIPC